MKVRHDLLWADDANRQLVDNRHVPAPVRKWLLLIAVSFAAGCLTIALLPSHQARVVNIGVGLNVAMAVGIGAVLARMEIPERMFCAAGLGAVVTVAGWDLLSYTQAEVEGQGWGYEAIPLDVFALPIAAFGMLVLLGAGVAIGGFGRLVVSRCPCDKRSQRLRSPVS
jgi:hypothetical protein